MDGESVSYDPAEGDKPLFNNPKLSDVRFLVGGQIVYGHKVILAKASPVFERMFYGELKEKREVIEIKDLTLVGFKNALRYIYGFKIDYELSNLYESFMAADKYLLHRFSNVFFDYVQSKLNVESSCLIYDQLVKIGDREEIRMAEVRSMIIKNSRETIESEHFTKIDKETLISLLSLDRLNIEEADLLVAVSKWVDCEVQRHGLPVNRENRRRVFQPIKSYVLFTALTPKKAAKCKVIPELLTVEEAGSLLLHLNYDEPLMIELKTSRSADSWAHSVFVRSYFSAGGYYGTKSVRLTVSQRVSILAIHLTYSQSATDLSFQVQSFSTAAFLNLNIEILVKDGMICLSLSPPLGVEAYQLYDLTVICNRILAPEDQFTSELSLSYGSVHFSLNPFYNGPSFVRGFEFVPLD